MYWQIKKQTIMEDDCFYDLKCDWKGCVLCLCLDHLQYTYNENNYSFDLTYVFTRVWAKLIGWKKYASVKIGYKKAG